MYCVYVQDSETREEMTSRSQQRTKNTNRAMTWSHRIESSTNRTYLENEESDFYAVSADEGKTWDVYYRTTFGEDDKIAADVKGTDAVHDIIEREEEETGL